MTKERLMEHIREHCDLMIEDSIKELEMRGHGKLLWYEDGGYEDGRLQGIKDACRIILTCLDDDKLI